MKPLRYTLLLLSLVISQNVLALRCGHYVITTGMSRNEVYRKCGEPDSVDTRFSSRGYGNSIDSRQYSGRPGSSYAPGSLNLGQSYFTQEDIVIEEWIYNFGASRIQQYLRFENGRLQEIRDLGRGYRVK